jgi:putative transposase
MMAFIEDHREAYGVEPICKMLPIARSTYPAYIDQRIDASVRSVRARLSHRHCLRPLFDSPKT